jgi:hypothetical protein
MHACSVWGWLLYVVDDEALHLVFLRFELEAELVLNDEEDRVAGIRIGVGGVEGMFRCLHAFDVDVVCAGEAGLIDYRPSGVGRENDCQCIHDAP